MTAAVDLLARHKLRPVYVIPCAWCAAPLCDNRGNPRWHITFHSEFVCHDPCRWPQKETP